MHHRTVADPEIERVEDILRKLKRRELAGTRLPRGPNLPPPEPIPVAPDAAGSVLGRAAEIQICKPEGWLIASLP